MGRRQRDDSKEAYWRGLIERQQTSGLSVRAFCRDEGLAENSFYVWRRTIRQRDEANAASGFAAVVIKDAASSGEPVARGPMTLTLASGHSLSLPETLAMEEVVELLIALERQAETGGER